MICPYCGTRNIHTAVVCSQCGAILRDSMSVKAHAQKKSSYSVSTRKFAGGIFLIVVAAVVAAAVGFALGRFYTEDKDVQEVFALAAAIASAIIMVAVSYGGLLIRRFLNAATRHRLSSTTTKLIAETELAYEERLKEENTAEYRYKLASLYLLANDLDKSVHQFEQASQLQTPSKADDLNNMAVAFALRGQTVQAFERFERSLSIQPDAYRPLFNLTRILTQSGREADAERAVQKLTAKSQLVSEHPDLLSQLGMAYVGEGKTDDAVKTFEKAGHVQSRSKEKNSITNIRNNIAVAYAVAGKVIDAQIELSVILKQEPENARALANYGVLLIGQGKYPQAIEKLSQALFLDNSLALAHSNLGYAYCMSNAINEGIREFRAAVLLEPNIFEAQYNLGKAYLDEGVYDAAEKSLTRALQLRRTSWQTYHAFGVMHFQSGLIEKALAAFNEALKLEPDEPALLSALAVCCVKQGRVDDAISILKDALLGSPHNPELLTNLSWLYILVENLNEASDMAKRAIAEDEAMPQPYNNLGLCQLNLGAPDVAMEAFKKVRQLDPSLVLVHYHMGNTHVALKQLDNAIKEWNLAAQAEPGNADIYTNLGVALYRSGRTEDAILEFRRVLKVRTDRMEDYINLGLALAAAKHHKEAIEQFDKALAINPRHAAVHSNRGLACYFANIVEEALREWQLVTQLDPAYAKRRGKKQESEYDDAIIEYVPLYVTERTLHCDPHTAGFLYKYLPGYDTDKWMVAPPEDSLEELPIMLAQLAKVERQAKAMQIA